MSLSRTSHVAVPRGWEDEGNRAASCVRRAELSGVRVCKGRDERDALVLVSSGPRKIVFSTLASIGAKRSRRIDRMRFGVAAILSIHGLPCC